MAPDTIHHSLFTIHYSYKFPITFAPVMIQYFKNINHKTVEIDRPEDGAWINVLPPLKQEEFSELSEQLDIPIDFLTDFPGRRPILEA